MSNPNHLEEQETARERKRQRRIAEQKRQGTYVPTPKEKLYDAMVPAFKAGMTKDDVRTLIYAARCVHSQGTAIATGELEAMLEELMQKNLFMEEIIRIAAIEKEGIVTPIVVETGVK